MENIKNKIKELRISKNLTQQQLADELHVTKQAISKWEKGKSVPDIASVELIASFFGVSADYLINDSIEATDSETPTVNLPKRIGKLNIVLISISVLLLAALITVGIILINKFKIPVTVEVNGFEITYLADETQQINENDKTITLNFNIYNQTDFTKTCTLKNFSVDNGELSIQYIYPDGYDITAHEELKLRIVLIVRDYQNKQLGNLNKHSVTVKYAGRSIANIKW